VYGQNPIPSSTGDALDVEVPFAPGTLGVLGHSEAIRAGCCPKIAVALIDPSANLSIAYLQ
jgi:hypothetical protein